MSSADDNYVSIGLLCIILCILEYSGHDQWIWTALVIFCE